MVFKQFFASIILLCFTAFFMTGCGDEGNNSDGIVDPNRNKDPNTQEPNPIELSVDFSAEQTLVPAGSISAHNDTWNINGHRLACTNEFLFYADSNVWKIASLANPLSPVTTFTSDEPGTIGRRVYELGFYNNLLFVEEEKINAYSISADGLASRSHSSRDYEVSDDAVFANNNYYMAAHEQGLLILNGSVTAEMLFYGDGTLYEEDYDAQRITVNGNTAYVSFSNYQGGYYIVSYDVSNPASPVQLGSLKLKNEASDVIYHNGKLLIDGYYKIWIADVSDPSSMKITSFIDHSLGLHNFYLDGNIFYWTDLGKNLFIYDLTDLSEIKALGRYKAESQLVSVITNSTHVFVKTEMHGIKIFSKFP